MTNGLRRCVLIVLAAPMLAIAAPASEKERPLEELAAEVLPAGGHHSRVVLGDSIVKLVKEGVLEPSKLEANVAGELERRGLLPRQSGADCSI